MAVRLHASTTARARETPRQHVRVDVLDLDGGFVHQHADGERQSAERHDVDGLARQPTAAPRRASSANGMLRITISALRQSRRKSSTIRPVSSAPSSAFDDQAADGVARRTATGRTPGGRRHRPGRTFLNRGIAALHAH